MTHGPEDLIGFTTESPTIRATHETKAKFNELLSAALVRNKSKDSELEIGLTKVASKLSPIIHNGNSKDVPIAVPRKKHNISEKLNNDSLQFLKGSNPVKSQRHVIAEVHSSRSRLLPSSSDDDILSEKKERKKRKKFRLKKQATEVKQLSDDGEENQCYQINEETKDSSPSRLSNRSYTVETPTFPVEEIMLLTAEPYARNAFKNSNAYLTIPQITTTGKKNTPTVNTRATESEDSGNGRKTKIPVPLPRRKSLKSMNNSNGNEIIEEIPSIAAEISVENKLVDTVITIFDSSCRETEDDFDISKRTVIDQLQGSLDHNEELPLAVKKLKKKKKRRKVQDQLELQDMTPSRQPQSAGEPSIEYAKGSITSSTKECQVPSISSKIVGVTIYSVDRAVIDPLVSHPVVRLHIVDTSIGEYYSKSDASRPACYFNENTTYIPPIMTHPFDFKQHQSLTPEWDECILINESLHHMLGPNTLLLFELCDFLPASLAASDSRYRQLGSNAVWHTVAWAFLRLTSLNVGSRLKLQLFKPAKYPKYLRCSTPVVYEWWGSAVRHKFPACLDVSVSDVDPSYTPLSPRLRSRSALQSERGSTAASVAASDDTSDTNCGQEEKASGDDVVWSRLPAQSCKVPNTRLHSLAVDGCMSLQFSGCGRWLACASQDITVFTVPQFQHTATLSSHQGLVYCLRWSEDSKILLSASADCTICIWRPKHHKAPLLQMLAHPSFVYCAQFLPGSGGCTIVSGCYDGVLRLWRGDSHSTYRLAQEVTGPNNESYVTALCVTTDGARLVVGDNQGAIRLYQWDEDENRLTGGRELRMREGRGKTVNNLLAHPGGHRLLVHTRDSLVRSVDIATGAVIQTFKGCKNERLQIGMCVSPCGSLVVACGEDGNVAVWDGHTGQPKAVYYDLLPPGSAVVHYHPHDHLLAVCSLAQPPLHILSFDRNSSGMEVGLNMIGAEATTIAFINETHKHWYSKTDDLDNSSRTSTNRVNGSTKEKESSGDQNNDTHRIKWPSISHFVDKSSEDKDLRLLEIIKKMDNIIFAAKQSSQPYLLN